MPPQETFSMLRSTIPLLALTLLAGPAAAAPDAEAMKLYVKKCANCHGEDGNPTKMGKKYDAEAFANAKFQAKHSDDELEKAIRKGVPKTKMKAFEGKLTDDQIKQMVDVI